MLKDTTGKCSGGSPSVDCRGNSLNKLFEGSPINRSVDLIQRDAFCRGHIRNIWRYFEEIPKIISDIISVRRPKKSPAKN